MVYTTSHWPLYTLKGQAVGPCFASDVLGPWPWIDHHGRSWSLFVGSEALQIQQMSDRPWSKATASPMAMACRAGDGRTPIFEENSKDVFVCHGSITQKPPG